MGLPFTTILRRGLLLLLLVAPPARGGARQLLTCVRRAQLSRATCLTLDSVETLSNGWVSEATRGLVANGQNIN